MDLRRALLLITLIASVATSIGCVSKPRRITITPGTPVLIAQATKTTGYVLNDRGKLEGPYLLTIPEGYTAAPYDWGDDP